MTGQHADTDPAGEPTELQRFVQRVLGVLGVTVNLAREVVAWRLGILAAVAIAVTTATELGIPSSATKWVTPVVNGLFLLAAAVVAIAKIRARVTPADPELNPVSANGIPLIEASPGDVLLSSIRTLLPLLSRQQQDSVLAVAKYHADSPSPVSGLHSGQVPGGLTLAQWAAAQGYTTPGNAGLATGGVTAGKTAVSTGGDGTETVRPAPEPGQVVDPGAGEKPGTRDDGNGGGH